MIYPPPVDTQEAFLVQLRLFYQRVSPENEFRADQVCTKFWERQEQVWPLLYHKYSLCSCVRGEEKCSAQVAADELARERRRRRRELEDADEDNEDGS